MARAIARAQRVPGLARDRREPGRGVLVWEDRRSAVAGVDGRGGEVQREDGEAVGGRGERMRGPRRAIVPRASSSSA
jgi:hypothetical protein